MFFVYYFMLGEFFIVVRKPCQICIFQKKNNPTKNYKKQNPLAQRKTRCSQDCLQRRSRIRGGEVRGWGGMKGGGRGGCSRTLSHMASGVKNSRDEVEQWQRPGSFTQDANKAKQSTGTAPSGRKITTRADLKKIIKENKLDRLDIFLITCFVMI